MAEVKGDTIVDGRYRIVGRIGSGGMAEVYQAEDTHLARHVALKVLHRRFSQDEEFVERFRREASAAAGLQHPNVVNVFDRGQHDGTYYIAMEHLQGRTLKDVIGEEAPLDQERVIDLGIQILQAAGFAHRRGVIHRDFKPQNAIVDATDGLKVTDFGIARAGASEMTETGSIMGTAQYLSPEQAQGHAVEAESDLYSIGVMMYEMVAGRLPFEGDSAVAIALKHLGEPPPPLRSLRPDAHPALEAAILKALAKDPAARYGSAEEFIDALDHARAAIASGDLSEHTLPFAPLPAPGMREVHDEPFEEERRTSRWTYALIALLLLALAAAVAYAVTRPEQVSVPEVVGQDLPRATTSLERRGFEVDVISRADSRAAGTVLDQDPDGGVKADEGSTVELVASSGPSVRVVPPVANLTERQATKKLSSAGFTVNSDTAERERSATVKEGSVVRTDPPAGRRVRVGSEVQLILSLGPEMAEVPDVVGLGLTSARLLIENAGLVPVVQEQDSEEPKNEVLSQDPAVGTSVKRGARVTLTVSKGPKKVELNTVPSVVGLEESEAAADLRGAGFEVATREAPVDAIAREGEVLRQSPGGGRREEGSTVTITIGRFEEEPDVAPADPAEPPAPTP